MPPLNNGESATNNKVLRPEIKKTLDAMVEFYRFSLQYCETNMDGWGREECDWWADEGAKAIVPSFYYLSLSEEAKEIFGEKKYEEHTHDLANPVSRWFSEVPQSEKHLDALKEIADIFLAEDVAIELLTVAKWRNKYHPENPDAIDLICWGSLSRSLAEIGHFDTARKALEIAIDILDSDELSAANPVANEVVGWALSVRDVIAMGIAYARVAIGDFDSAKNFVNSSSRFKNFRFDEQMAKYAALNGDFDSALRHTERNDEEYGGHWFARSDNQLLLIFIAKQQYRHGQQDEAFSLLDRLRQQAEESEELRWVLPLLIKEFASIGNEKVAWEIFEVILASGSNTNAESNSVAENVQGLSSFLANKEATEAIAKAGLAYEENCHAYPEGRPVRNEH